MEEHNIETSLVLSIAKSDIKDIATDIAELSLDSVLDDGVIKDIPILGTLAKLYSAGKTIKEKIFEKKIIAFLRETEKVNSDQRDEFYQKMSNNENLRKKIGEQILVIIEKIDDLEKPKLLGKLFKAFMEERISFEMFHRFATIISNCFLPDLRKLPIYKDKNQFDSFTSVSLENLGLVHLYYVKPEKFDEEGKRIDGSEYQITQLGIELLKLDII